MSSGGLFFFLREGSFKTRKAHIEGPQKKKGGIHVPQDASFYMYMSIYVYLKNIHLYISL